MAAILSRLFILFINYILRDLNNTKYFLQDFCSVPGCPTCVNAGYIGGQPAKIRKIGIEFMVTF